MRKPSRPRGSKGTIRPRRTADPKHFPLDRSWAQKQRTDRKLSPQSETARANYWANLQQGRKDEQDQINADLEQIGSAPLADITQFGSANISEATLESAAPGDPSAPTIAGLGEGGIVPPPAPGR